MRYLSLFSGVGGFESGIIQAYENNQIRGDKTRLRTGDEMGVLRHSRDSSDDNSSDGDGGRTRPVCIGYSEIDKYATQIYQKHFPNHHPYGDITKIDAEDLPEFDLLVGGFPCQSFSIAGKRGGFDDTRGTLFFDIARIAQQKQPRLLLLENVKGLLSHDKGRTFRTIISTLDELGYDLQWQVLNSKNHGVPQNRERIFIIGHSRGTPRPKVFPLGESSERSIETCREGELRKKDITAALKARDYKGGNRQPFVALTERRTEEAKKLRREGVVKGTRSLKKLEPRDDDLANTVTTGDVKNQSLTDGAKIRRLTPTECMRLQGFPDDWCDGLGISDTQKYKVAGNAVTTNVVRDIMIKLL